jgi:alkylated DNA repair dioxygenase AlkB
MAADPSLPPVDSPAAIGIDLRAEVTRVQLDDTSWVDIARGWIAGAAGLFEALARDVAWQAGKMYRYDHWVEERRLSSFWRPGLPLPHPALADIHRRLQHQYRVQFDSFSLLQYRDGNDGQAFHRDTDMRWLDETVIAIVTLGARRPWLLRPRDRKFTFDHAPGKGATHDIAPGAGDLHVMGGRCQADWEHSVPYLPGRSVAPRISLQWRYTSRRGRPFMGSSYGAPLTYDRPR